MIRYELITNSTIEPVTLAEVKLHVKADNDADDTLLTNQIKSARRYCERYTARAFINQTWLALYDYRDFLYKRAYYLPYGKIVAVNSINVFDSENVATLISNTKYVISGSRINFNDGYYFDTVINYRSYDTFEINWTVGYGATAADVPQDLKQAILLLIGHWYENRGAIYEAIGGKTDLETLPLGVLNLLDAYRIYTV